MQFSDQFCAFLFTVFYSTFPRLIPWTLAIFCTGIRSFYRLFTYWYSARFCPSNARDLSFLQTKSRGTGSPPSPLLRIHYAFSTSSRTNIIRKLTVSRMHETQMPLSPNCFVSTLPKPAPTANTPITAK